MNILALTLILAFSIPQQAKHIQNKYHVEYQGTTKFDDKQWWYFIGKTTLGPALFAVPADATDKEFEMCEDSVLQELIFNKYLHNEQI